MLSSKSINLLDSTTVVCQTTYPTRNSSAHHLNVISGSVIQQSGDEDTMHTIFDAAKPFSTKRESKKDESDPKLIKLDDELIQKLEENRIKFVSLLHELRLRYFTPIEIAKLLGFPVNASETKGFTFPPDFSANSVQAYRVLGNSLSVTTVSFLASLLFLQP